MAIQELTNINQITASTLFAISNSGLDRSVLIGDIITYLEANLTSSAEKNTEYDAPSATGFTTTITDSSSSVWMVLTPVAGYAAGTIVLPSLASAIANQEVLVNCTQAVTTLTMNGNGSTVTGAPTGLTANQFFTLRFEAVTNTWYRVG